MEAICSQCHAVLRFESGSPQPAPDWCPGCGGALIEQETPSALKATTPPEVDHRGIVLPRRHALGGIITPQ